MDEARGQGERLKVGGTSEEASAPCPPGSCTKNGKGKKRKENDGEDEDCRLRQTERDKIRTHVYR